MSFYIWLLFITLPFGELLSIHFYGFRLRLLDVLIFFGIFIALCSNPKSVFRSFIKSGIAPLVVILLLSSLFYLTHFSVSAFAYLVRFIMYAFFFSWILVVKPNKNYLYAALTSFLILLLFGFLQYFLYPTLRPLQYLGIDPHYGRLTGLFLDPNIIGAALAYFTLFFVALPFPKKIRFAVIPFGIIALLFTYSRISIITAAIGVPLFFLLQARNKKAFLILATALLIGVTAYIALPKAPEGSGTSFLRLNSIYAKNDSLSRTITLLTATRGLGIGFNNLDRIQKTYDQNTGFSNNSTFAIDNSYFTILATAGIAGIIAYGYFLWRRVTVKNAAAATLGIMLGIHSLSVNSFFTPSLFLLWTLLTWLSLVFYTSPYTLSSSHSPQHQSQ